MTVTKATQRHSYGTLAFYVLVLALVSFAFRTRGLTDPGTFWHTRVGEIIVTDGFMNTDPFTFTFEGKTWIPQQWLGEVLMYGLHRIGGWDAMLWVFCAIFAITFACVFRRLLAGGMGWPLAAAVAGFALIAASFHFYLRPHVFTIVFMIITTGFIVDADTQRRKIPHLYWLIPLFIIWTNIHGGMLGGVVTLLMAIACWTMNYYFKLAAPITSARDIAKLMLIVVLCALTMFVNPIGLEMQRTWFRLIGSTTLAEHVPEHSSLSLARGGDVAVVGFAVLYAIILAGAGRPKLIWLIPIPWLIMSVTSIRNGPLFVAVAAVIIADIWPHTLWFRKLRTGGDTLAVDPVPLPPFTWRFAVIPAIIVVIGLALQHFRIAAPVIGHGWATHDPAFVPTDLAPHIRNIPPGARIYNDPNLGGFLIWHAPHCKIFMDDRFELCGDAFLNDYVDTVNDRPQKFDDWQKQYGFTCAVIAKEKPAAIADFLRNHKDWVVVEEGEVAILYKRK